MYIKKGIAKFINKEYFKHFTNANIHIELKNKSSHLIFVQTELDRKLLNSYEGTCYCKLSKNIKNLHLHQLGLKKTLKQVIFTFLELGVGLKITLPNNLQEWLQAFLDDKDCMMKNTTRSKR